MTITNTTSVAAGFAAFDGELIAPDDPGYDAARITWNAGIQKRPALIARAASSQDVAAAVSFARDRDLPIAVRGGGHSVAGHSTVDDGVVIDLSPMKQVAIDTERSVVRAGAGLLLGELDRETQRVGLAVPAGTVTHTGVAGLTLGGGLGWLMRRHGLTVDNLLAAELVTAGGEIVTASPDINPDLFWGLRGGGGNFGVVTSFTFQAHPVGPIVTGGMLAFPFDRGDEVLRAVRDLIAGASEDLTLFTVIATAPPHEPFPAELQGRPVVLAAACHIGDPDVAAEELAPLRALGPTADLLGPMPFTVLQGMIDETAPHGRSGHSGAVNLPALSDDVIRTLLDTFESVTSPFGHVIVPTMGGAVSRVAPDATAYPHRSAPFMAWVVTQWLLDDDARAPEHRSWVRSTRNALSAFGSGVYVNALSDDPQLVSQAYGPNLPRLREIKRRWDPDNLFRLNANITPA